jgi:predicted phage tail protein
MTETTEIRLYGHLRAKFGASFRLAVSSPQEAIRALSCQLEGFKEAMINYEYGYRIRIGAESLGEEQLFLPHGGETIRIVPCVVGAKNVFGQILMGVALVALVYFTGGSGAYWYQAAAGNWLSAMAINMGMAMVLGGVAQILAGNQSIDAGSNDKGPADKPTFAFSSPHLTVGQGNPVGLGYGKLRVGGAIVSLGICSESWTPNGLGGLAADEIGTRNGDGRTAPWMWALAPAAIV